MRKYIIALLTVFLALTFYTPTQAKADAGEGVGLKDPTAGWSGSYQLKKGSNHQVWCLDFGKAEPMANGGTQYSKPEKLEGVPEKEKKVLMYALQEGEKAVKTKDKNLAAAVSAIIHESSVADGKPFDSKTMVPAAARKDYQRIKNRAPEVPAGSYLTVRMPKDWQPGGSAGYQRVLDYDQVKFGQLHVSKADVANQGKTLPGAEFQLRSMNDEVLIKSFESKEDGSYTIQLSPGQYKVIEGRAPVGYKLNGPSSKENTQVITVDHNSTTQVQFLNKKLEPKIGTKAVIEGDNLIKNGGTIIDTVKFEDLNPGQTYTLAAEMMCKENGQPTGNTGTKEFTPTAPNGEVNVEIPVTDDSCSIQTAFETLTSNNETIAEHKDINSVDQTVGQVPPAPRKPRVKIDKVPSGPTGNVTAPDIF